MNKILLFIDIPHSSRATVTHMLLHQYGRSRTLQENNAAFLIDYLSRLPQDSEPLLDLIMGRGVSYGLHRYTQKPAEYFAVLQNPVTRTLSHYHALTGQLRPWMRTDIQTGETSLLDFAKEHANAHLAKFSRNFLHAHTPLNRDHLSRTIDLLENGALFLCVDDLFYESLFLAQQKFHWEKEPYVESSTSEQFIEEIASSHERDQIAEMNQLEMDLYEYVTKKIQQSLVSLSPTEAHSLKDFLSLHKSFILLHSQFGHLVTDTFLRTLCEKKTKEIRFVTLVPQGRAHLESFLGQVSPLLPEEQHINVNITEFPVDAQLSSVLHSSSYASFIQDADKVIFHCEHHLEQKIKGELCHGGHGAENSSFLLHPVMR